MSMPAPVTTPSDSLVTTTHVVYALHTLGLVIGAFGTATVIGTFLFGWPSIIAVIINYVKRSDVRGTWLDSHFSWQIRTFWWAMLWAVIIGIVGAVFAVVLVGFAIWIIGFCLLGPMGRLSHRTRLAATEGPAADAGSLRSECLPDADPIRRGARHRRASRTSECLAERRHVGQRPHQAVPHR